MNERRLPDPILLRLLSAGVVTGLTGAMLLATSAFAADTITSTVKVNQTDKQFSGAESRAISLAASRVLMHVDGALDALRSGISRSKSRM